MPQYTKQSQFVLETNSFEGVLLVFVIDSVMASAYLSGGKRISLFSWYLGEQGQNEAWNKIIPILV